MRRPLYSIRQYTAVQYHTVFPNTKHVTLNPSTWPHMDAAESAAAAAACLPHRTCTGLCDPVPKVTIHTNRAHHDIMSSTNCPPRIPSLLGDPPCQRSARLKIYATDPSDEQTDISFRIHTARLSTRGMRLAGLPAISLNSKPYHIEEKQSTWVRPALLAPSCL